MKKTTRLPFNKDMPVSTGTQGHTAARKEIQKKDLTITMIEKKFPDKRWCGYCTTFHSKDDFSDPQKLALYTSRYCTRFSNENNRAKSSVSLEISNDEIRPIADAMKFKITDLPDLPDRAAKGRKAPTNRGGPSGVGTTSVRKTIAKRKGKASTQASKGKLPAVLTSEELDTYLEQNLPALSAFDEEGGEGYNDTHRGSKHALYTYDETLTNTDWTTALSDVRSPVHTPQQLACSIPHAHARLLAGSCIGRAHRCCEF